MKLLKIINNNNADVFKTLNFHIKIPRFIKTPFDEEDILYLQKVFLFPNAYYIKIKNMPTGRTRLKGILKSLNYHKKTSCLSTSHVSSNFL